MRSGRIRSELRSSARMGTSPAPSTFGGRDSRVMTCSCWRRTSAASSIVTIRSVAGMNPDRALSSVVLPDDVPPETRMLRRARTAAARNCIMSAVQLRDRARSWTVTMPTENLRMLMHAPLSASGGMTTLTREPSASRASHIGELSSTRRSTELTTRSITSLSWRSLSKTTSLSWRRPARST